MADPKTSPFIDDEVAEVVDVVDDEPTQEYQPVALHREQSGRVPPEGVDSFAFKQSKLETAEEPQEEWTSPRKTQGTPRTAGIFASALNMANTVMGAGLLALPYAARKTGGILWALVLIIFFAFVTLLSIRVLVIATDISLVPSYAGLARELWGHRAAAVVHLAIFMVCFSASIAYLLVLGDVLEPVFKNWGAGSGFANKYVLILLVLFTVLLPLTFMRSLAPLAKTSAISVMAEVVLMFGLVARAAHPVGRAPDYEAAHAAGWCGFGFFVALPLLCFAFACTSVVHHIYAEMVDPTPQRMTVAGALALAICATAYAVSAVCGYIAFGVTVDADVLNSFAEDDELATVIRICIAIAVSLTYPLNMYPARQAVCSCYRHFREWPKPMEGRWLHPNEVTFRVTAGLVVVSTGIAFAASGIDVVLGFIGSHVGAMLLIFIPHCLYYGHLRKAEKAAAEGDAVSGYRYEAHKGLMKLSRAAMVLGAVMWLLSIIIFYTEL
eukprot:TRINITY_DN61347_c0_g1_i1.p1 TRINITY_DN61347_c0_g1~~TRINITY_DN61347_c0_g1_i1.p1  ORF type:complete len:520 (+),score=161.02 TRINITY_DN61347_c0_g1_i1:75-1562(+)